MDEPLLQEMEARLGADLSTVRIHSDAAAESAATAVDARVFTSGEHIVGGPGALDRRTIAHELTHVLQQRSGPVAGNDHGDGLRVSDPSDRFEREADAIAQRVMAGPAMTELPSRPAVVRDPAVPVAASRPGPGTQARPSLQSAVVQRAWKSDTMQGDDATWTDSSGRAAGVRVENVRGTPLDKGANAPSVDPFGWQQLRNAGHTLASQSDNKTDYNAVRMHLWNGRLGGPGNTKQNLAPGPADVNGKMSKDPETKAKNLVKSGKRIWLETRLTYQNNTGNANDFTSVIPNQITMKYGEMGKAGETWTQPIRLPDGALSSTEQAQYKSWAGTPQDLVNDLASKSDQFRSEAFILLQDATQRLHALKAYPNIYREVGDDAAKGNLLEGLKVGMLDFVNHLTKGQSLESLVELCVLPLGAANHPDLAHKVFTTRVTQDEDRLDLALRYKGKLVQNLDKAVSFPMVKENHVIFNYFTPSKKAEILGEMNEAEIDDLIDKHPRYERPEIFDNWAKAESITADQRVNFIQAKRNVSDDRKEWYRALREARRGRSKK
ncbi:DUF4157 domain-containing protein [Streptomyces ossamyceticus]|uniref:eCIS core domain-containing protein n=1 Tax=Streptomyces ossamyceticus TaxID=249581 RepID=UPI0036ED1857